MIAMVAPLLALVLVASLIYWLGGGSFGRAQTQAWIDYTKRNPAIHGFLDRHHGKFRASAHYLEFGGLYLVLWWLVEVGLYSSQFGFRWKVAVILWIACAIAAFLDELHQLKSGTRQFRRVDFLHSCCGITIAMAITWVQALMRGLV